MRLNYACYQDARFMIVGTPSGVTLAPEGGAHQSIAAPLIGMSQDGLAAFEPAFADELGVIMEWAFDYLQRDGAADEDRAHLVARPRPAARSTCGFRRTRSSSPAPRADDAFRQGAIDGGYWLRPPGPNARWCIAYQGVVAPEVIRAAGLIARGSARRGGPGGDLRRSAERGLDGGAARARAGRQTRLEPCGDVACGPAAALPLVTVIDGHPGDARLARRGAGPPDVPLGVEHFGQTGTIGDLYRHFGIDAQSIVAQVGD